MQQRRVVIDGGRYLIFYSRQGNFAGLPAQRIAPPKDEPVSHLRWHPLLREWVINATHRQERPNKPPAEFCPLCPTRPEAFPTEVPAEDYEIVVFQNRFPSLSGTAPELPGQHPATDELYIQAPAQGEAEVVLYSPQHDGTLWGLGHERIVDLVNVWTDRFNELQRRDAVQYVFIFENRGEAVGVTLTHPHGQIYGYPFVPPLQQTQLQAAADYKKQTGRCLHCDILHNEQAAAERIVYDDGVFLGYVPYFARFPYEVHVAPKRHVTCIADLTADEQSSLARCLQHVTARYDGLFGKPLSYMMTMHQRPTDGQPHDYTHFNIQFYPVNRSADKVKYLAGSESGAGTFVTDMAPEHQAQQLQAVVLPDLS